MNDTIRAHFQAWLKSYYPEACTNMRNGVYVNTATRQMYEGFLGACACMRNLLEPQK